jgi:predicted anti-sigma-YlaC factor YlaD
MRLLLQADLDGELMPVDAAGVAAHLERCAACAGLQSRLLRLAEQIRQEIPQYVPPEHLLPRSRLGSPQSRRARSRRMQTTTAPPGGIGCLARECPI